MKQTVEIQKYLNDLESRIDPQTEDALIKSWRDFWEGRSTDVIFSPERQRQSLPMVRWHDTRLYTISDNLDWPNFPVNAIFDDFNLMAAEQLATCSDMLRDGSGHLMCVRPNYGTGILPSLFGAEPFRMEDRLNTLPTVRPLAGGEDDIKRIIDAGVPDFQTGLGGKTLEMSARYKEMFAPYPKIRKFIPIYHPDIQGPMDVAELLYGSDIFIALISQPDLIQSLLRLITDTYIAFMDAWLEIVGPQQTYTVHWGMMMKSLVMIRDDSAMNLSPEMFETFIKPYDQEILNRYNGGAIHFCGKGDHFIEHVSDMDGVYGVHMSQPEYNDPEMIFKHTVDKNIRLIGLTKDASNRAVSEGRDLNHCVHCVAK